MISESGRTTYRVSEYGARRLNWKHQMTRQKLMHWQTLSMSIHGKPSSDDQYIQDGYLVILWADDFPHCQLCLIKVGRNEYIFFSLGRKKIVCHTFTTTLHDIYNCQQVIPCQITLRLGNFIFLSLIRDFFQFKQSFENMNVAAKTSNKKPSVFLQLTEIQTLLTSVLLINYALCNKLSHHLSDSSFVAISSGLWKEKYYFILIFTCDSRKQT